MEQASPLVKIRNLLACGALISAFSTSLAAQVIHDNFREIGGEHADANKLLDCSTSSDQPPSAYVYFAEAKHFAGFHEGTVNDGRLPGTLDAKVTDSTITWKMAAVTEALKEESFTLDRKTGALEADVSYPAPDRHLSLHCTEDSYFVPDPAQPGRGKWINYFNNDHLCYSGFPAGIHSKTPIRVYVVNVELWNWHDKDHPQGRHIPDAPMNKAATDNFVDTLNKEALTERSDTSFVAADSAADATLYAKLEYHVGINEGADHRNYLANVYIGGMGLTTPVFGVNVSPPGQRWFLVSYQMESNYEKYDVKTPGEAAQIAFDEVTRRVVNGWSCGKH